MKHESSFKFLLLLGIVLISISAAAPRKSKLVHFYPISQSQYDSILRITNGRPVISEGLLLKSGFRAMRNSIATDLSSGWRKMLNVTNFLPEHAQTINDGSEKGYPLCVIKPADSTNTKSYENSDRNAEIDPSLSQGRQADGNIDDDVSSNSRPSVSCIVVVRRKHGKENKHERKDEEKPIQKIVKKSQSKTTDRPSLPRQMLRYYYPTYAAPYGIYPSYSYLNYPGLANMQRQFGGAPMPYFTQRSKLRQSKSKPMARANQARSNVESPSDVGTGRRFFSCNNQDEHNSQYGGDGHYGHHGNYGYDSYDGYDGYGYDNNYGYYGDSGEYYNSGDYW